MLPRRRKRRHNHGARKSAVGSAQIAQPVARFVQRFAALYGCQHGGGVASGGRFAASAEGRAPGLFSAFFSMRLLDHSGNPLASAHILTMADDKDQTSARQKSLAQAAKRARAEAEARRKDPSGGK